ncbi:HNH endonuclease [Delftia tsuruhatensis]|uniref:HNH endonuclease n=1 Tax=Delftia tsuruhatensis TaxID=180282 RepID=UPI0006195B33|nr:HNH endonuclease [Delftia tsuruhatensis]
MQNTELTQSRLFERLSYDKETGIFTNRFSGSRKSKGEVSGRLNKFGYRQIQIDKKLYSAHRLAWLYVNGEWPDGLIDHINRVRDDNRISNLRVVTRAENNQNIGMLKTNTSGYRGVHYDARGRKWRASITVENKKVSLGSHLTPEKAYEAYVDAARRLHTNNSCVDYI